MSVLPEDLSDAEINRRVFGLEKAPQLKSADRWKKPFKNSALDDWIEALIGRPAKSRIRLRRTELEALASFCPYHDGRLFVAEAAIAARGDVRRIRQASNAVARDLADWSARAGKALDLLDGVFPINPYNFLHVLHVGTSALEPSKLNFDKRELQTVIGALARSAPPFRRALKELIGIARAKQRALAPASKPGDLFGQAFVEYLGCYLYFLTGEDPTADNLFVDMAAAAYQSLSVEDRSLKSQIRTVVGRMPEGGFRLFGKHRPSVPVNYVARSRGFSEDETAKGWALTERLARSGDAWARDLMRAKLKAP
jgi:hypothetical protein